jgi:extradiol dioxygenase family protein
MTSARRRDFYGGMLGLSEGGSASVWVDWNFCMQKASKRVSRQAVVRIVTLLPAQLV